MLTLHLEANSLPELVILARAALTVPEFPAAAPAPVPAADPVPVSAASATLPTPAPRPGRKSAAQKAAEAALAPAPAVPVPPPAAPAAAVAKAHEAQSAVPPTPAAAVLPTVDETRAALHELSTALGMPACVELMKTYGADRVSTVPAEKRAEFIKECQAKVVAQKALLAANAAAKAAATT